MTRRKLLTAGLLLLLLPVTGLAVHFTLFATTPVTPEAPVTLQIRSGSSLHLIARQLATQGVVGNALYTRLLARLRGQSEQVQAGNYTFSLPATPAEVLDRLVRGDVDRLQITIPEGFTLQQIAARIDSALPGQGARLLELVRDPAFIAACDIDAVTLEGYLFPETYTVTAATSAADLVRQMVAEFRRHWSAELQAAAASHHLSRHQLVTLASIIQKEAGNTGEMPLISAVFHNRLQRGMLLQADPTVIYGLSDFDGNLTRRHLETVTPYNTYKVRGLPPGPIASPGLDALRAAAFPAEVNYLYFVATGGGAHHFSATLKEHNQAVRRYQLKRR